VMTVLGLWRYAGAGSEKEYIDFGVLENVLLQGVIGVLVLQQCPLRS
jgi:hypothetical protein